MTLFEVITKISNLLFYVTVPVFAYVYLFPLHANIVFMNLSYGLVYSFSKVQIYINKRIEYLKKQPYILNIIDFIESFSKQKNIEFIKNNKVVEYKNKEYFENKHDLVCYDFFIYSHHTKSKNNIYKSIHFYVPDSFEYSVCKYTFISFNIIFSQNEIYNIELKDGWISYYVVNNRINRLVLFYLLNKKYGVDKKEDEMYVLEFIDNNANIKHISEEDEIVFGLNEYTVVTYKKESNTMNDYPSFVTKGKITDNIDFKNELEDDKEVIEEDYDIEFIEKINGQ